MLKTLAWKETRELMPLAALVLIVECLVATAAASGIALTPWTYPPEGIPFYSDSTSKLMLWVGGLAAAVLGLTQTARESSRGTLLFLLYRPASRDAIFGTKLVVGTMVYAIASGLPLGVYTLWAATPGTHASPFLWSMAAPMWLVWAELVLLYLGGFLSGLRPGRWFGTRSFPLVGSLLIFVLLQFPTSISLPVCALICAGLVLAILAVAETRDY
jgi:ABC-type transport system involved in multi-copper enzyme maturation permease subunit